MERPRGRERGLHTLARPAARSSGFCTRGGRIEPRQFGARLDDSAAMAYPRARARPAARAEGPLGRSAARGAGQNGGRRLLLHEAAVDQRSCARPRCACSGVVLPCTFIAWWRTARWVQRACARARVFQGVELAGRRADPRPLRQPADSPTARAAAAPARRQLRRRLETGPPPGSAPDRGPDRGPDRAQITAPRPAPPASPGRTCGASQGP